MGFVLIVFYSTLPSLHTGTTDCANHPIILAPQVEAVLASTVAQLSYDDFSSFVESLGSRMAKRVSKRIASVVLDRFVQNEQRADYEDRRR